MERASHNPTGELYSQLQRAGEFFNVALFNGELPPHVLTLQRERGVAGHFSAKRWAHISGEKAHEIALNPKNFASCSLVQLFQTIVHEQCHLWQFEHGNPSRPGYHNKEWADKMLKIGLVPSATGLPGGSRVGQKMSDYPDPSGGFLRACNELIETGFALTWVDRGFSFSKANRSNRNLYAHDSNHSSKLNEVLRVRFRDLKPNAEDVTAKIKRKTKYMCPTCGTKAWGKPRLNILCGECKVPLVDAPG